MTACYTIEPIKLSKTGIPVFSDEDFYSQNYDKIAADHLAVENEKGQNPFMPDDLRTLLEESTRALIRKYLSPGDKILDVGVALGRLLDEIEGCGKYGTDISLAYLETAQQKGIDVCLSRAEELPYKENFFDMVVCTDMLEHVFDLMLVAKNLLAVLKPGGVLIIRVPQNEYLKSYFDEDYPYEYVHMRTFDLFSLRALFEKILGQSVLEWSETLYPNKDIWQPLQNLSSIQSEYVEILEMMSSLGMRIQKIGQMQGSLTFFKRVIRYLYRKTNMYKQYANTYKQYTNTYDKFVYANQKFNMYLSDDEIKYKLFKGEINMVIRKQDTRS